MTDRSDGVIDGVVEAYDSHEGLGWIAADGHRFLFHCAELLDGTREVEVGRRVRFVVAHRFGHVEASEIEKR